MHDAPRTCAQADNLFALTRSLPARTSDDLLVNFICGNWGNRLDLPVTDAVPFLGNQVRYQQHRPLVITTRTLRDFLEIGLRLLVLAEQPINRTVSHETFDWLAGSATFPFIEQRIERGRSPTVAILAACRDVIGPEWFAGNRTTQSAVIAGQVPIECNRPVRQSLDTNEPGQEARHAHRSSATSRTRRRSGGKIA